ncbi:MAG: GTPase ObgE [Thermoguttaceae bacterium]|nr:GTPase ObgE [Thermoguttaceae bacterium]
MFVDEVEIEVIAGKGGDGCASFRREKYVPRGGPDGGDGGRGGNVIFRADKDISGLGHLAMQKVWKAKNGQQGQSSQCHGASAEDLIISVPVGTMVFDLNHDILLKDLTENGADFIVARGGFGGKGNLRFKTATNRAPRTATPGEAGQSRQIRLELKMIAQVGLVGKPNAGKSTLLSRLSRARPEVASYPFTTKSPCLGLVQVDPDRSFVMADIPGLIEGAHQGIGLGHDFLKHIQRAGILVHLVEPCPDDGTDPVENYRVIRSELERYDAELGKRQEIVVVTKTDLPQAATVAERFREELKCEPMLISSATGSGLRELVFRIAEILNPPTCW